MKKYQWLFFDADETLFHFDAFRGLVLMFSRYGVDFTREDFDEYQLTNKPLWVEYQNGTVTAYELQTRRFASWAEKLGVTPEQLNSSFLDAMAEICEPLEGVREQLDAMKGKVRMAIITNGFTALQNIRLERTGLKDYFDFVVVSEEIGVAKPDPAVFDYALEQAGFPSRDSVLMVGDTLGSDVLGGLNSGMDACWFNHAGNPAEDSIKPTYTIQSFAELGNLICY